MQSFKPQDDAPAADAGASADQIALHRAIDDGIEDFENGDTEDAFEFLARLKARREDRDRQAGEPAGRARK